MFGFFLVCDADLQFKYILFAFSWVLPKLGREAHMNY